jgi:hypothetical protein
VCTNYVSSIVETEGNGKTTTQTIGVIVTTNSVGVVYTTSSLIGNGGTAATVPGIITEYITTCISTLPGGHVATSTANVVISTNSRGMTYTTSSILGSTTSIAGAVSSFKTTYVTTSGNFEFTTSGEVVYATNAAGSTYTTTLAVPGTAVAGATTIVTTNTGTNGVVGVPTTGGTTEAVTTIHGTTNQGTVAATSTTVSETYGISPGVSPLGNGAAPVKSCPTIILTAILILHLFV